MIDHAAPCQFFDYYSGHPVPLAVGAKTWSRAYHSAIVVLDLCNDSAANVALIGKSTMKERSVSQATSKHEFDASETIIFS